MLSTPTIQMNIQVLEEDILDACDYDSEALRALEASIEAQLGEDEPEEVVVLLPVWQVTEQGDLAASRGNRWVLDSTSTVVNAALSASESTSSPSMAWVDLAAGQDIGLRYQGTLILALACFVRGACKQ